MRRKWSLGSAAIIAVLLVAATAGVHAQNSNMKLAYAAFEAGQAYKNQGDLVRAKKMYQLVLSNAPVDTNIYREAENELGYYLPLMKIQRLLWDGKTAAAEQQLLILQQKFDGQPLRRQEIGQILSGLKLNSVGDEEEDKKIDERLLMRQVKKALSDFYQANNNYPTNGKALTEVLAMNRSPLSAFDIRRYSSDGNGYLLVLRSKKEPNHTLTLEDTGLMQAN